MFGNSPEVTKLMEGKAGTRTLVPLTQSIKALEDYAHIQ